MDVCPFSPGWSRPSLPPRREGCTMPQQHDPYGQLAIVAGLLAMACRESLDLNEQASEVRGTFSLTPNGLTYDIELRDSQRTLGGFGQ